MELQALYGIAKQQNIEVLTFPLRTTGSVSVMEGGKCFVGMDQSILDGSTQERTHLAHELGHCVTGSFYNRYAAIDCRQRHENRANKRAIEWLIPLDALDQAIADGHTALWDLAEHFGVTEDLLRKAVCWYTYGNLATELFF